MHFEPLLFKLEPVALTDAYRVVEIEMVAFKSKEVVACLSPNESSALGRVMTRADIVEAISNDSTVTYMKAVKPENQTIVAFAKWIIHATTQPEIDDTSGKDISLEISGNLRDDARYLSTTYRQATRQGEGANHGWPETLLFAYIPRPLTQKTH
jgi:hypothetical protein